MKANELRIGNLVYSRNSFEMNVVSIFPDEVYLDFEGNEGDYWEEKQEDLQPIPLTEEWLLKFGFEKTKSKTYTKWKVDLVEDEKGVYSFDESRIYIDIQSVHQLQNLYFALTGDELTIKTE